MWVLFLMVKIIVPVQFNFFYLVLESFLPYNKTVATNTTIEEEKMTENRYELNKNLAQMLKGGVIMDVQNPEQARIAEAAGATAVMALERIPADIRAAGGVSRMSDPKMIKEIQEAVSIPVMRAKCCLQLTIVFMWTRKNFKFLLFVVLKI